MWEHSGGCCGATNNMTLAQGIFNALGWSGLSGASGSGSGFTIGQSDIDAITNNGGTLDYSGLLNKQYSDMASGVMNIPSICNSLGGSSNGIFVCDPGRTGSLGVVIGQADVNPFDDGRTSSDLSLIHI